MPILEKVYISSYLEMYFLIFGHFPTDGNGGDGGGSPLPKSRNESLSEPLAERKRNGRELACHIDLETKDIWKMDLLFALARYGSGSHKPRHKDSPE